MFSSVISLDTQIDRAVSWEYDWFLNLKYLAALRSVIFRAHITSAEIVLINPLWVINS